jgi:hypothetical protein
MMVAFIKASPRLLPLAIEPVFIEPVFCHNLSLGNGRTMVFPSEAGMKNPFFSLTFLLLFTLFIAACGSDDRHAPRADPNQTDLSNLSVFQADSPYRDVLVPCVTAATPAASCTLATLPLLAMSEPEPTIDAVMERVAVSHEWMGQRFREVLAALPPDMLTLMQGVTAVVIDDDIRPSFYSSRTGAIYLDPAHLWLTNEEKATVAQASDYRSGFGNDLSFLSLWRYTRDNAYAYRYFSLTGNETREIEDIRLRMAAVLYHELAHANDLIPADRRAQLNPAGRFAEATAGLRGERISDRLDGEAPLTSAVWKRLATVLFRGEAATVDERLYSPEFVGAAMEQDGANDNYAYASPHEDVAMLFEEAMMKYHFGLERDIAYTVVPKAAQPVCDDYLVKWGYRNRIAQPEVSLRARQVVAGMLPEEDLSAFFAALAPPIALRLDEGWCRNLEGNGVKPMQVRLPGESVAPQPVEDLLPPHWR